MAFKSRRDDGRADWRVVLDELLKLSPGESVSHDTLAALLDASSMAKVHSAARRARRELWRSYHRSVENVRGEGYRMLHAQEHRRQADAYRSRGRRQVGQALSVVKATNLSELDSAEREWTVKVETGLTLLGTAMDDVMIKVQRQRDDFDSFRTEVRREIDELKSAQ
jgi:hypothetical protein